jgi:hypothetical protein
MAAFGYYTAMIWVIVPVAGTRGNVDLTLVLIGVGLLGLGLLLQRPFAKSRGIKYPHSLLPGGWILGLIPVCFGSTMAIARAKDAQRVGDLTGYSLGIWAFALLTLIGLSVIVYTEIGLSAGEHRTTELRRGGEATSERR